MENASEALMMAFGVLIFVLALTVAITSFSQARNVSDDILYMTDTTNYYDYDVSTGGASQSRIVGLETIIPTLYNYYKENYTVVFREGKPNEDGSISNREPFYIYTTPSKYKAKNGKVLWGKLNSEKKYEYDYLIENKYLPFFDNTSYNDETNKQKIFSFDLDEEALRNEPWTGSEEEQKKNIDCFLKGNIYYRSSLYKSDMTDEEREAAIYIDYNDVITAGSGGFINWCNSQNNGKGQMFVETIGEYAVKSNQAIDTEDGETGSSIGSLVKQKSKRVVIYTKI